MDFSPSARSAELTERVRTFVTTEIEPVEPEIHRDIKTRRDENGNLYSNTKLGKGEASLWAIEFRGEIVGVVGASGSGKTVLSKAIVNWIDSPLRISSGKVMFKGRDILALSGGDMRRRRRDIAYVGANPMGALDPTLPVGAQIVEKLRAVAPEISKTDAQARAIELLEAVRIPSARARFHDYPSQYSGGMMQRALIVDAMVANPTLLVADNVTQPLDVTVAAQVIRLMRELSDTFDTAVLFVSSSLPVAREAAGRILVMDDGRLVEEQPSEALVAAPRHAYTRELVAQIPVIWGAGAPRPPASVANDRQPVIRLNDVSQTYDVRRRGSFGKTDALRAVRNVTFDVHRGDSFAVVGESGCGKSTLMRLLSRLEKPSGGQILCEGQDISRLTGRALLGFRRKLQLVLQDPFGSLPPRTSIGAMIEAPLRVHGWRKAARAFRLAGTEPAAARSWSAMVRRSPSIPPDGRRARPGSHCSRTRSPFPGATSPPR